MSIIIDGQEYYGIIYKIENIVNNKVYIGQTSNPRGFNGRYDYKGTGIERVFGYMLNKSSKNRKNYNQHLFRSIEKYGIESFVVDEVIDVANTQEELDEKERYYIEKFDSYKNGYNKSFGGDSMKGAEQPRGKLSAQSKSVCQISKDGELIKIWDCIIDAANELGIQNSHIGSVCRNQRKSAGGFVWVYEKDYDTNKDYKTIPRKKDMGRGTKPVFLLSENNEVIQEFYSSNYAADCLGISRAEACLICNHKIKTPPFNLKFKSEYLEEQRLSVEGIA